MSTHVCLRSLPYALGQQVTQFVVVCCINKLCPDGFRPRVGEKAAVITLAHVLQAHIRDHSTAQHDETFFVRGCRAACVLAPSQCSGSCAVVLWFESRPCWCRLCTAECLRLLLLLVLVHQPADLNIGGVHACIHLQLPSILGVYCCCQRL